MTPSNKIVYIVKPDTFLDFDNGFTFIKDYKYQRYNHEGTFAGDMGSLIEQVTCLYVRILMICDDQIIINQTLPKHQIGFKYQVAINYISGNTIYTSAIEQLREEHFNIELEKLKCIGVLKDITINNDVEIVFVMHVKEAPDLLKMTAPEIKKHLLSFDQLSRFLLEQIDYVI